MNKKQPLFPICIMTIVLLMTVSTESAFSQSYDELWKQTDIYLDKGLAKSVDKILDVIENKAIKEKNSVQQLKTVLYRFKIFDLTEEEPTKVSIAYAKNYLSKLEEPAQSLLHVAIADLYADYLEDHRYKIRHNERTVGNLDDVDMKFWDQTVFDKKITEHYQAALSTEEILQKTSAETYKSALVIGLKWRNEDTTFDFQYEPTLYDYVMHKKMAYLQTKSSGFSNLNDMNTDTWWRPAEDFLQVTLPDLDSPNIQLLRAYQQLEAFDIKRGFKEAVLYNDLQRLMKLREWFENEQADSLSIDMLQSLEKQHVGLQEVTSVMALHADILNYLPDEKDNNGRFYRAEALAICDEAIQLFPESKGAEQCEDLRKSILAKELTFSLQPVVLPDKPIPLALRYRNVTEPHYRIYKISSEDFNLIDARWTNEILQYLSRKPIAKSGNFQIPAEKDYREHSSLQALPQLGYGLYYVVFSPTDDFSEETVSIMSFQVSQLTCIHQQKDTSCVVYVLDRKTGLPINDATVSMLKYSYSYKLRKRIVKTIETKNTGEDGLILFSSLPNESLSFSVQYRQDELLPESYFSPSSPNRETYWRDRTNLYTDRAIYRPGQTVYFKGVAWRSKNEDKELRIGEAIKVTFYDANSQVIEEKQYITNEFGAFDGSFLIPSGLLKGVYDISTPDGSVSIRVEEYKRPTFEVEFDKTDTAYKINETAKVEGTVKALAGFGLDNVSYTYQVKCEVDFWRYWLWDDHESAEEIANGTGKTDENGHFQIEFKLKPKIKANANWQQPVYNFMVTVTATNAAGETQSQTYTLRASYSKLIMRAEVDEFVDKNDCGSYVLKVTNLNGDPVKSKIARKYYRLADGDRLPANFGSFDRQLLTDDALDSLFPEFDYYSKEDENLEKTLVYEDVINVDGEHPFFPNDLALLQGGKYYVEFSSVDDKLSKLEVTVSLYDVTTHKMPYKTPIWTTVDALSAQPGDTVHFYVGTSVKNAWMNIQIKHGHEVRLEKRMMMSDTMLDIPYVVQESDRDKLNFVAFFVHDNRGEVEEKMVEIPYDNLKLDVNVDVERQELLPGEEETWTVTVKDFEKHPVTASLLAGMYDSALDVFAHHTWKLDNIPYRNLSGFDFSSFRDFRLRSAHYMDRDVHFWLDDILDVILLSDFKPDQDFFMRKNGLYMVDFGEADIEANPNVLYSMAAPAEGNAFDEDEMTQNEKTLAEPVLRENFNETAFFYPNLVTNEDGSVSFSFKMPDALTRWKCMLLAYTKDLKVGTFDLSVMTKKPVMIMPDLPRFVYENDTIILTANVINMSDDIMCPQAKLEVFDAATMQPVEVLLSQQDVYLDELEAGSSRPVSWKVALHKDMELLAFRFTVLMENFSELTGNFSDAEQRLLPVLSNEIMLTQTFPITASANSNKEFNFKEIKAQGHERDYALTLNFSANPVWYAIQSLPYLADDNEQSVMSTFYRFYANAIASYVANQIPNFQNYIKKWQIETPEALMSQLQKDEDLKAIMLQETPWVLEAKSETEQKARLGNLFDLNTMRYQNNAALKLLASKQKYNGGWPWFDGMPESDIITGYVLEGLGRMEKMGVIEFLPGDLQNQAREISQKACRYMQKSLVEDYNDIKPKDREEYRVSSWILDDLFALSYFTPTNDFEVQRAIKFFLQKLEQSWPEFSIGDQARAAMTLHRAGKQEAAALIMRSIRERAHESEDLGVYWSRNQLNYFASQLSEHVYIMEAFSEIAPVQKDLDAMKIWLLTQKRTNMWEEARSSVDAVYALLNHRGKWLANDANIKITIGTQTIDLQNGEAGTGFVQKRWPATEMQPDMSIVKIDNPSEHPVWGGLFRQYFVPVDEVRASQSPLSIKRELFVEKTDEKGTYLIPIEGQVLHVGDKVVSKLTFENNQDMEFVFLKDLRAACLEPAEQVSYYRYRDGMFYYQSITDVYDGYYFDHLPKGIHQVSHTMYVSKPGDFTAGHALIQCQYAPEFTAYSKGERMTVFYD